MQKIAILGGGASGVISALLLQDDYEVVIFEREERLLKKLLRTGNGKANIYRRKIVATDYNDQDFLRPHLAKIESRLDTLFKKLNINTFTDAEGRVYPYSRSAKTLVALLLAKLKAKVKVSTDVKSVTKKDGLFIVNDEPFDYLILALGSSAGLHGRPLDNGNTSLLTNLNLASTPLVPVIKTIAVEENLTILNNERHDVMLRLYRDETLLREEVGEVLFKEQGLSGIASFIISSDLEWSKAKHPKSSHHITLDLMPEVPFLDVQKSFTHDKHLMSTFSLKMRAYLETRKDVSYPSKIKALPFKPRFNNNPENTQALHGGVKTSEINECFQSQKDPALFILGEILNIDGRCGGLNLSFAFYSALTASNYLLNILSK